MSLEPVEKFRPCSQLTPSVPIHSHRRYVALSIVIISPKVNETGTALYYQPGLLIGGELDHDCNVGRGIGYFLEPLLQMAPFTKNHLKIRLKGVTNNQIDPSVDNIKSSSLPLLEKFLGESGCVNFRCDK